jgi:hypothetical protein
MQMSCHRYSPPFRIQFDVIQLRFRSQTCSTFGNSFINKTCYSLAVTFKLLSFVKQHIIKVETPEIKKILRPTILTAVVMKSTIFRDTTPYSPLKVNRRFGGTYRLHFQGRVISLARNQRALVAICFQTDFLLGLFFGPGNRGDMLLRNVG